MILARVCGNVVATHHEKGFAGKVLKIVVPIHEMEEGVPQGAPYVVLDRIGVNDGEIVLLETAMESSMGLDGRVSCDAAIIAIVDRIR